MADAALEGASAYNARVAGLQEEKDNQRKNDAYNALAKIYGPTAGDPDSAIKDQNYLTATQQDPLRTQGLALKNTGDATANDQAIQNLDQSRQLDPLKVLGTKQELAQGDLKTQSDQLALNTNQQLDPLKVQQQQLQNTGADLGNQGAAISNAGGADALAAQRAARERTAAKGLVGSLQDTFNSGGDLGAAFDQLAPQIAAFEGVDPSHMAPLKEQLLRDPRGTLAHITAALAATEPPTAAGRTSATALAANTPQAHAQQADALDVIHERTAAVPATIDQAASLIPQMSSSAIIRKARMQIPGTPEYKFEQAVKSISSNLALDDLRAVRQSGLSLGRTNLAEFQASANAFGNLDLGQDSANVSQILTRLKGSYAQINSNITADISRLRSNGAAPTTGPAKPTAGISYGAVTNFLRNNFGVTQDMIGSEARSAADNKRVGGAPNSAHLTSQAIDFTPPGRKWTQTDLDAFSKELDARGIPHTELIIEQKGDKNSTGYHVHWGWAPKNGKPGGVATPLSDADLFKKYGITG